MLRVQSIVRPFHGLLVALIFLALCEAVAAQVAAGPTTEGTVRVRGRVVDASGRAVAGATVGIVLSPAVRSALNEADPAIRVRTDDRGDFAIVVPRKLRKVVLVARVAGSAPAYSHELSTKRGSQAVAPLRLTPGVTLQGQIIGDEDRVPVEKVKIHVLEPPEREDTTGIVNVVAMSDRAGRFVVRGLLPEAYTMQLEREGFVPLTLPRAQAPAVGLSIKLFKGAYLSGRVADALGQPIANAAVSITPAHGAGARVKTDTSGRFRFGPFARGTTMELLVSAAGHAPARDDDISAPNDNVVVVLARNGALRGRVVDDATGAPVTQFRISFHRRASAPLRTSPYPGERPFQSPKGEFQWADIQSGVWTVTIESVGYQPLEVMGLDITGAREPEFLQLRLIKGNSLRGRVFEQRTGRPVAGVTVTYAKIGSTIQDEMLAPARAPAQTGADGAFELQDLPAGALRLNLIAANYVPTTIEVQSGRNAEVAIALEAGATIRGQLVRADGQTGVAGVVTLFTVASESFATVSTDASGAFEFEHLGSGQHVLTGYVATARTQERELVVLKEQQLDGIILALSRGPRIEGKLYGLLPGERGRAHILISDGGEKQEAVSVSDRDDYVIEGAPSGRVNLTAETPLQRSIAKTVDAGQSGTVTVDFTFPSDNHRVTGTVTRGGSPVPFKTLTAMPADGQNVSGAGETTRSGQYVIQGLAAGTYVVGIIGNAASAIRVVVAGDTKLNFELSDMTLSGQVTDASDGTPVSNVAIEMRHLDSGGQAVAFADITNHSGSFSIVGIVPGNYRLVGFKAGFDLIDQALSINASVADLALPMRRAGGVAFSVVDAVTGMPLPRVIVSDGTGTAAVGLIIALDQRGAGQIPANMIGRDVTVSHYGYQDAKIAAVAGAPFSVRLQPQPRR